MARNKFNPLRILIAVIFIYLIGEILLTGFYYLKAKTDVTKVGQALTALKNENEQLNNKIKELQTSFAIEKAARENLDLAKTNETVVYFKNKPIDTQANKKVNENFFQKIVQSLLKLFQK
jgi:cell division protein FtsL